MKQNTARLPRFLIGAPASNSGKTTVTCALLQAFKRRGLKLLACKSGPDYIDPAFHTRVIGAKSRNIDLFFTGKERARHLLARNGLGMDLAILEGAMGFYDGISVGSDNSAWDIARTTESPVVLVVDGRGRARSISAEVLGFTHLYEDSNIRGLIINRCSPMLCERLAPVIEKDTGVPVLGCMPILKDCLFESRHLGLVGADELDDLMAKLNRLADAAEENIDLDALCSLAATAPDLPLPTTSATPAARATSSVPAEAATAAAPTVYAEAAAPTAPELRPAEGSPLVAIAYDHAFNFYYEDAFDTLRDAGLELAFFSPCTDTALPAGASGLYLGGGYPELHARELSENTAMLDAIHHAITSGMPTIAECGGFLYLHEQLEDDEGAEWPLVGTIKGHAWATPRLNRFGYVGLTAHEDSLLAQASDVLPAHEFHYWESDNCGSSFTAQKPQSSRHWECVHTSPSLYAGFPHLALQGQPKAVARFAQACAAFNKAQKEPAC